MEKYFFIDILTSFGKETFIPKLNERDIIHTIIYDELSEENIHKVSEEKYLKIINRLIKERVEGIILGCTEIPLLMQPVDVAVPIFDTTKIHAITAFHFSNSY